MYNSDLSNANTAVDLAIDDLTEALEKMALEQDDIHQSNKPLFETLLETIGCAKDRLEPVAGYLDEADNTLEYLQKQVNNYDDIGEHEYQNNIETGLGTIGWNAGNNSDIDIMNPLADCFANPKLNRNKLLNTLHALAGNMAGINR